MPKYPEKSYDVANWGQKYVCCCLVTNKTLSMQEEEVILKTSNCCCTSRQKRPYAQLNLIEHRSTCCGLCHAINSDLDPVNEEGKGGIVPGCGCSEALVNELVAELNMRRDGRGQAAQMRQQQFMLRSIAKLTQQVPILLKTVGAEYPPSQETMRRIFRGQQPLWPPLSEVASLEHMPDFDHQEFNVTNLCEKICACTTKRLDMMPDEAVMTTNQCITGSVTTTKVPYANMDSVNAVYSCGCCASLTAGELTQKQPPINPACGCAKAQVEAIRAELQQRVDVRGNMGQIKQLEKMMGKFHNLAVELPLILDKVGADTTYPPTQHTMDSVYGASPPQLPNLESMHQFPSVEFETREVNVKNQCHGACTLLSTCGCSGCTKHTITLEEDQIVTRFSNNCDKSVDRKPYAQLDAVDDERSCCCCYNVNGLSPGCGCDKARVEEISTELQRRKVGRGGIAQLRSQENTIIRAIECDVRADVLMHHSGVQFPPTQETMHSIYGQTVPTLPPHSDKDKAIHLISSEKVDTKSYGITNYCDFVECCCQTENLELNGEEAVFTKSSCCLKSRRREPYFSLASVEPSENCCGVCKTVATESNIVSPGCCGANTALVEEIAGELQQRKLKRGNIAQIRQQENLMIEIIKLGVKLDLLFQKRGLSFPPTEETLASVFGAGYQPPSTFQATVPAAVIGVPTVPCGGQGLQPARRGVKARARRKYGGSGGKALAAAEGQAERLLAV